jgi:hypothetical protein
MQREVLLNERELLCFCKLLLLFWNFGGEHTACHHHIDGE